MERGIGRGTKGVGVCGEAWEGSREGLGWEAVRGREGWRKEFEVGRG